MRPFAAAVLIAALAACGGNADEPEAGLGTPEPSSVEPLTPAPSPTIVAPPPAAPTTPAGEPVVATTAAALAEQLVATETAIRNPATPARDMPRLGWTQQVAYRILVRNPALKAEVLPLLPSALRPVAEAHVAAGDDLRKLAGTPKPELPKWQIVPPAPAAELEAEYRSAQATFGVPWEYLAAIHLVETRMGRIRGTSVAGAQGPMQFLPSSWELYGNGGDINSNHDSILAACRHLIAGGAPDDMAAALYAYNPSPRYVRAVTAYADQMRAHPRTYLGYHGWQVYYGDHLLPEGYRG